jgi:hypothetical protein
MNDPDSISNSITRRISYNGSYPLARFGSRLMTWMVGPHCPDVSTDWSPTWHANCACWLHNYVMLMSSSSGSITWVLSGIQVGWTHPSEEDAWGASVRVDNLFSSACSHFWHPNFASFSPACSSWSPLHGGGQWPPHRSFEQNIKCQLCFSFNHIASQCAQSRSSGH